MNKTKNSGLRWPFILGYIGILSLLLGCMAIGVGSVEQGILQLDDGIIKVQDQNGDWVPLAASSSFELTGALENTDPWTVAGRILTTNESTQIEAGLQDGTLVHVRGTILEDDTWLAYSIESADEETSLTITLIGEVTSIDPWVVNGMTLNVTDETIIEGEVTTGMLVRVEILLLEDGTWEVISISPLGDFPPTSGCARVIATVVSVSGNEIQFLGWPATVILVDDSEDENGNEDLGENEGNENEDENNENEDNAKGDNAGTVEPGQKVVAVVCVSEDGTLVIVQITVLEDDDDVSAGAEKVLVCHKPDKKGGHTISIAAPAVPAHLAHGDTLGPCPTGN
jgi:hypothetical protein